MQLYAFTTPRPALYYSLGEPGPEIQHVWVCLHGHDQPVSSLAAQLVNLDTPERLLILPEALSRHARPETSGRPSDALGVWFAPHSVKEDLADVTTYLDGLTDAIRARCPAGTPVTVLGYGGAAAAVGWLAENHLVFERLILYAAVLPPEIDRRALFAALPPRPVVVVSTTADGFTPEADGRALVQDLLDAGQTARLSYADEGPLTLAALGADREEGGLRAN